MVIPKRGAWLIPRVTTMHAAFSSQISSETVSGYKSHQVRLADITDSGTAADNSFHLRSASKDIIELDEVRSVRIIGHADRVWKHGVPDTMDEDRVSQRRAEAVWDELQRVLNGMPGGAQMLIKAASGNLEVIVVGVGARMRINKSNREAPEDRRVTVELWPTRTIPV